MIFPSLSDAERAVLEDLLLHGANRSLPTPIRGRLGLYKLIDETPDGWKITPFGQQALQAAPAANASSQAPRKEGRSADHERHYGKKNRDTSWFG
jgi:hypothetical protein